MGNPNEANYNPMAKGASYMYNYEYPSAPAGGRGQAGGYYDVVAETNTMKSETTVDPEMPAVPAVEENIYGYAHDQAFADWLHNGRGGSQKSMFGGMLDTREGLSTNWAVILLIAVAFLIFNGNM